jgi:hypothetical protein
LELRFGWFLAVRVPLDRLAGVRTAAVSGHRRNLVVDAGELTMSVMGDTNVELRFEPSITVALPSGGRDIRRLAFYADDPRAVAGLLRSRVG